MKSRAAAFALALAGLALTLVGARTWLRSVQAQAHLESRVAGRVASPPGQRLDCAALRARRPLVLLALGQSNAGNHGVASSAPRAALTLIDDRGDCLLASDPLPGATGRGASIWARLPEALQGMALERPIVIGVLAVDATRLQEWLAADGPMATLLQRQLAAMKRAGLPPALVLWHQGEGDAQAGTTPDAYAQGLRQLAARVRAEGVDAPWLLAKSTICRSPPSAPIRNAIDRLVGEGSGPFRAGPDIDEGVGASGRSDGCHLSEHGLELAAQAWATAILPHAR